MHKINFGERKTPHVEGLLFAIKSSDIWVFEKGEKKWRFGDCFEKYKIKGRNIGNWGDCFFSERERESSHRRREGNEEKRVETQRRSQEREEG